MDRRASPIAKVSTTVALGRSSLRSQILTSHRQKQGPNSAASPHLQHLQHLQEVAAWASSAVPALGAFLGSRLASTCIIETQHVEALAVLLQGLCGSQRQTVKVHELCLKSGPNLGQGSSEVHLLCDLSQQEPHWSVRHVGGAMRGAGADQMPALVRSILNCRTSNNALRFFYALGYKLDYELLQVGFKFQFHKVVPITVAVTSLCKIPKLYAIDEAVPITSGLQLVEITSSASADNYSEVATVIAGFAEHLAPLLHLSKPGVITGVIPTASSAAASLTSRATKVP